MIEVRNLTVAYGEYIVLDNVNLKIKPGQMTIIVGSSGCGKGVLMRTILGLKIPQNGEVFLFGENLFSLNHSKQNEMRKKISMLFQSAALLDSMNVFQNVALPAVEHLNLSEEELSKLVQEKLQLVGLRNVQEKYPAPAQRGQSKFHQPLPPLSDPDNLKIKPVLFLTFLLWRHKDHVQAGAYILRPDYRR